MNAREGIKTNDLACRKSANNDGLKTMNAREGIKTKSSIFK